jgi:hypothetical protein
LDRTNFGAVSIPTRFELRRFQYTETPLGHQNNLLAVWSGSVTNVSDASPRSWLPEINDETLVLDHRFEDMALKIRETAYKSREWLSDNDPRLLAIVQEQKRKARLDLRAGGNSLPHNPAKLLVIVALGCVIFGPLLAVLYRSVAKTKHTRKEQVL